MKVDWQSLGIGVFIGWVVAAVIAAVVTLLSK
jgi:hypothetical protein